MVPVYGDVDLDDVEGGLEGRDLLVVLRQLKVTALHHGPQPELVAEQHVWVVLARRIVH